MRGFIEDEDYISEEDEDYCPSRSGEDSAEDEESDEESDEEEEDASDVDSDEESDNDDDEEECTDGNGKNEDDSNKENIEPKKKHRKVPIDDGIDVANIVTGKRSRKPTPARLIDELYETDKVLQKNMLDGVGENEMDAALLDSDFSEDETCESGESGESEDESEEDESEAEESEDTSERHQCAKRCNSDSSRPKTPPAKIQKTSAAHTTDQNTELSAVAADTATTVP